MQQIEFTKDKITLSVKKAPKAITLTLLTFAILSVLLPLTGLILNLIMGNGLHLMLVFFIGIMGFIGLYLFRMSLWNSRGKEIITINKNEFTYTADYGLFKDTILNTKCEKLSLSCVPFGDPKEKTGILVIGDDINYKRSVVKIPMEQLEKLIENFSKR